MNTLGFSSIFERAMWRILNRNRGDQMIVSQDVQLLRNRWRAPEWANILERLIEEKIALSDCQKSLIAVKKSFEPQDLRGVDFSSVDLGNNFLLFGLDLSHSTFSHQTITGSFQDSVLVGCEFNNCSVLGGYFAGGNISRAAFKGGGMRNVDFEGANLQSASFEALRIESANFSNVDLTEVGFKSVDFGRITFRNTKVSKGGGFSHYIEGLTMVENPEGIIWV